MANPTAATLAVEITAQTEKFQKGIENANKSVGGFASGIQKSVGRSARFLGGALVAGAAAGAVAVGAIGVAAFKVSNEVSTATNKMQSQLGVTGHEAERLGNVAANVWGNNFAGSIAEAGDAVAIVRQQFDSLSDNELQNVTEDAFRIQDAFGQDVPESVSAAKTLMEQFGLSSEEAFDFIASGFQGGLDRSGDFLDSINEYSTQFSNAGADAGEFFSLLDSGLQGGALGTDKAADLFKEFRLRINDGSSATMDAVAALETLDLTTEEFFAGLQSGSISGAEAFDMVNAAIADIEDPTERMQVGVALLGTQFEDLGDDSVAALSLSSTSMEDLAGATDTLNKQYSNLGDFVEGLKRRFLLSLKPIGDLLLTIANLIMPQVEAAFNLFDKNILPVIQNFASYIRFVVEDGDHLNDFLANLPESIQPFVQSIGELIISIQNGTGAFGDIQGFITGFVTELQNGLDPLAAFVEALLNWTNFGENLPMETFQFIIDLEAGIRSAIAAIMEIVAPIQQWIQENVKLQDVLAAIGLFIGGALLSALVSLAATIATIAAPILLIIGLIAGLRYAWENNLLGIQEKTQALILFFTETIPEFLENLRVWWAENGTAIMTSVTNAWNTIRNTVSTVINAIKTIVMTVLQGIQTFWDTHGESIKGASSAAWNLIRDNISEVINNIKTIIVTVSNAIKGFWDRHGEAIRSGAETAWNKIKGIVDRSFKAITTLFDTFKALFEGDWQTFIDGVEELWDTGWENVTGVLDALWSVVKPILDGFWMDFKTWLGKTTDKLVKAGEDFVEGLKEGIKNKAEELWNAAVSVVTGALNAAKEAISIFSPSKKTMLQIGEPFSEGIAKGIKNKTKDVASSAIDVVKFARDAVINSGLTEAFNLGGSISSFGNFFLGKFQEGTLKPLRAELEKFETAFQAGVLPMDQYGRRLELIEKIRQEEEKIAKFQERQRRFEELRQIFDLQKQLKASGLDPANILPQNITEATSEQLFDAMNAALEALINQTENTLTIGDVSGNGGDINVNANYTNSQSPGSIADDLEMLKLKRIL